MPITFKKSNPYNLYYILSFNLNQRYYHAICVWIRVLSLYLISHKNLLLANYNKLDDDDATGICTHFNKLLHSHGESKFHRIITEINFEKDLRFKNSFQTTKNNWNGIIQPSVTFLISSEKKCVCFFICVWLCNNNH